MTINSFPPEDAEPATPTFDSVLASSNITPTPPAPTTYQTTPPTPSAKDEAAGVASDATDAAKDVAGAAKDEAAGVVADAKGQAKDLYRQTAAELREQAGTQQQRVAEGLRTVGEQLSSMADGADQGVASDVVRQVSDRASGVASWLEARDPGSLLTEVRGYAARKPGTFIAIAALGGILAGRLTTSLVTAAKADAEATTTTPTPGASL